MSRARDLADGTFSGAFEADSPTFVVDSANNRVGVGTSSPQGIFSVSGGSSPQVILNNTDGTSNDSHNFRIGTFAGSTPFWSSLSLDASSLRFQTFGAERARIDGSGNTLFGCTSMPSASVFGTGISRSLLSEGNKSSVNSTAGATHWVFFNPNGAVGSISTTGSSTSYNTSSDYRLKENVVPLTDAADRIAQIPVHRFNFIADPDTIVDGFIAHEVQDVVPEAVTGEKDAVETVDVTDEDGNVTGTEERPVHQGIDQSKLVPLLTAALQEALADIATLKAEVAALKGSA